MNEESERKIKECEEQNNIQEKSDFQIFAEQNKEELGDLSKPNHEIGVCCRQWNRIFGTNYSSKQLLLLLILSSGQIAFGIAYSMQAPFLPTMAKSRGISEKWIGIISGILDVGFTTGSILCGKWLTNFKSRYVLSISMSFGGINLIFFGTCQWIDNIDLFKGLAVTLRILLGFGMGIFVTQSFHTVFLQLSEQLSKAYAWLIMCYAIGLIIGPVIGGLLFQLGEIFGISFFLPFLIMGIVQILVGLIAGLFTKSENKSENQEKGSFIQLLKKFGIALNVVIYFNAGALMGFNTATLDLHLGTVSNLSASQKGLVFFLPGIIYAVLNQVWGNLAHKMTNCYKISLLGCVASLVCFTTVGPLPFIPIKSHLYIVIFSQIFLGIGVSASLVGSFVQGFNETKKYGFTENLGTTAILSSLFPTSESMGYAIGPIIGGYVMDSFGYRWATVPLFLFQAILILIILLYGINKNSSPEINEQDTCTSDLKSCSNKAD